LKRDKSVWSPGQEVLEHSNTKAAPQLRAQVPHSRQVASRPPPMTISSFASVGAPLIR
jgi:hypothetical protein